ncbi:MAG: Holliday junction branch migration protein RuvA [Deltaproteobacteria bacterium]|nr:Holliday junction branch migration protein RuvA [Deltaproteobacteria bacterium]
MNQNSLIVDVGGVGYEVLCPKNYLLALTETGVEITLEIYTHVSENAFQLFGFKTVREKEIFQKLISVSGIGPKLGLTVISALPLQELLRAIIDEDLPTLTRISGIGKKTGERLIVELKDKFRVDVTLHSTGAANDAPVPDARISDVTSALINLGYPLFQARRAVNDITLEQGDTVQSLIKKSLLVLKK